MEKTNKYNINDIVYYISKNEVKCFRVTEIVLERQPQVIKYKGGLGYSFSEVLLFSTEQEAYEHLINELDKERTEVIKKALSIKGE